MVSSLSLVHHSTADCFSNSQFSVRSEDRSPCTPAENLLHSRMPLLVLRVRHLCTFLQPEGQCVSRAIWPEEGKTKIFLLVFTAAGMRRVVVQRAENAKTVPITMVPLDVDAHTVTEFAHLSLEEGELEEEVGGHPLAMPVALVALVAAPGAPLVQLALAALLAKRWARRLPTHMQTWERPPPLAYLQAAAAAATAALPPQRRAPQPARKEAASAWSGDSHSHSGSQRGRHFARCWVRVLLPISFEDGTRCIYCRYADLGSHARLCFGFGCR